MKKILLLSHSQKSGGAERCLLEAAIGLKKQGYDVTVFIPSQGELNDLLLKENIPIVVTPYPYWVHTEKGGWGIINKMRSLISIIKYSFKLSPLIRSLNPDYVLSNTLCIPCGAIVCKFLKKKHVWFIHEFGKEDHKLIFDFGFYLSSKIMAFTSGKILINSEIIKSKFVKYIKDSKFDVVNYNISEPKVNPSVLQFNASCFDLVIVGQITETKGQMDAVRATDILLKQGYDVRLILIGQITDEEYYLSILKFIKDHALEERVIIHFHSALPFSILSRFTIGLMCSHFEALGRVTIEYMKAGIPVIGAKAGSTMNLIDDCKTGLLYELQNHKDLAEKIRQLINNKKLVDSIVVSAKQYAETKFNEKVFIRGITNAMENN